MPSCSMWRTSLVRRRCRRCVFCPALCISLASIWNRRCPGTLLVSIVGSDQLSFLSRGDCPKIPLTLFRRPGAKHHGYCAGARGYTTSGSWIKFYFFVVQFPPRRKNCFALQTTWWQSHAWGMTGQHNL